MHNLGPEANKSGMSAAYASKANATPLPNTYKLCMLPNLVAAMLLADNVVYCIPYILIYNL